MDHTPPFDPPYTTIHRSAEGVRVIESLADGTTREVPSSRVQHLLNFFQGSFDVPEREAAKTGSERVPSPRLIPGNNRAMLFLNVPFAEKDSAKGLGAKWDATKKKWYVPHGLDINQFKSWWPDELKQ